MLRDAISFLFHFFAFCDGFRHGSDIGWFSSGVPQQSEPRTGKDVTAVTVNEVLRPFITVTLPLLELRISFCRRGAIVRVNDFVPVLQVAQFFFAVAQHRLKGAVGEGLSTFNAEKADPDLSIVKYRAEELRVRPKACLAGFAYSFFSKGMRTMERRYPRARLSAMGKNDGVLRS